MKVLPSFNIYKRKSIANLDHKLLLKILSYVPNRREAALVNKAFYGAVCEADFKDEGKNIYIRSSLSCNQKMCIFNSSQTGLRWYY